MTSVKLKFRRSSIENKEGSLYFQITHKKVLKQIKIPYKIFEFEWDNRNNDIMNLSYISPIRLSFIKYIKNNIDLEKNRLNEIIFNLQKSKKNFSIDDILKKYYDSASNKNNVFEYIETNIIKLKNEGKERTSEIYRQVLKSFIKFRNNKNLSFETIDESLICQYENYMRISNICRNTTSFYIRALRSIYNRAVEDGLTKQNMPFRRVYTGVDKTSKRAISLKEIQKIKDLDLSNSSILDFARDIFLFSFYMRGMSFIDIAYLRKKDLSNGFIRYNRRKTGQQMIIRWEKSMEYIVKKHSNKDSSFLLPIIINEDGTERKQYINKMLLINRHLKKIANLVKINIPLSMYVARHSWASIARTKNIALSTISIAMGHDSEKTTKIYLDSIQNRIIDNANRKIIKLLNKDNSE